MIRLSHESPSSPTTGVFQDGRTGVFVARACSVGRRCGTRVCGTVSDRFQWNEIYVVYSCCVICVV